MLVGPSGCGKTTALRLVNRMIELSDGDILIDGVSIRTRPAAELRRGIGYVIQQIGLFPHLTIGDNIGVVPRLLGWDRARIARRVEEMLDLVSLPADMRDRFPAQLSGGQRQRIGVARALAADPPLMLMDEPFGAIDPINRERLQNQFLRLQSEIRKTILFVTHDIDEAIKMGDRVAVMQKGGVLAQYAPPAELLMSPANDFVEDFVGADRALKRLALMRVRDIDLWKAPLARVGEPIAAVRAPDPRGGPAAPAGRRRRGPAAGLDVRARPGPGDGAREARLGRGAADPEIDYVLRDALSDLLQSDTPVRAGGGRAGTRGGRALGRDHLALPELAERDAANERRRGAPRLTVPTGLTVLAQVEIRERSGDSCIAQNNLCPGWIVDNFDRYTNPLVEHVVPDRHRRWHAASRSRSRWRCWRAGGGGPIGPIVGVTGVLYTLPSLAVFFLLLPITGRGTTTALIALTAYTLQIIFRNIITGLDNVPAGRARRRARAWGSRIASCCGGWSCRWRCPTSSPACGSPPPRTVGLATLAVFAGAGGLGEQIVTGSNITFKTGVVAAGGLAVLLALALDVILLTVQRVMTPWRRAQPA